MLSQLLQTNPIGTARGANQAQVPTNSFDVPGQPSVTPAQYLGPFIEAIKPGFEFGMETLGAKKQPMPPPFPTGKSSSDFSKALDWKQAMEAKPWAQRIENDPVYADQVVKNFQDIGGTKNLMEQWGNWYATRFEQSGDEQFFWRNQGLKQLKDRLPSASPASTPWICPPGWECT